MQPEQIQNRKRIVEMSYEAKTAHLGSALSAVDIIEAVYSIKKPEDKFVLSNGHAAVALYAVLERYGLLSDPSIERLGVHPDRNPDIGIEVSTGSLGQGLPIAVGMALAERNNNVYCCISDGECSEGSVWEALRIAQEQQLDNLRIIVNANGFDASDPVDLEILLARFQAQGCAVLLVDGHNLPELTEALSIIIHNVPLVLFAQTSVEQLPILSGLGAHYKILNNEEKAQALAFLGTPPADESLPIIDDGDEFSHLREVAMRFENPRLSRQLWQLCEHLSEGKDDFHLANWFDPKFSRVVKTNSSEWVIQCLDTTAPFGGVTINELFTCFVDPVGSVTISRLLANYNYLSNERAIEEINQFFFQTALANPGDFREQYQGINYVGKLDWLIRVLQELIVYKLAMVNRDTIFSFEHWGMTPQAAKNTVRHFVSACRKYPELMFGAEMRVGFDEVSSGRKTSSAILEALEENGLVSLGTRLRTNPLTVKLFDLRKIQLGEGFELKSGYGYLLSFREKQL